jgi:hypothetical protein
MRAIVDTVGILALFVLWPADAIMAVYQDQHDLRPIRGYLVNLMTAGILVVIFWSIALYLGMTLTAYAYGVAYVLLLLYYWLLQLAHFLCSLEELEGGLR